MSSAIVVTAQYTADRPASAPSGETSTPALERPPISDAGRNQRSSSAPPQAARRRPGAIVETRRSKNPIGLFPPLDDVADDERAPRRQDNPQQHAARHQIGAGVPHLEQ